GKTVLRLIRTHAPSHSSLERRRHSTRVTHGPVKPFDVAVETDTALVEGVVVSKHISLTRFALPEGISDRLGDRSGAIGDGVDAFLAAASDLVRVRSAAKGQFWICFQYFTTGASLHCFTHCSDMLICRFLHMAFAARLWTDILDVVAIRA